MHTRGASKLGFEMRDCAQVRMVLVEVTKRAPQQVEQLRFVMIALRANLDQLDKIGCGLSTEIILSDTREWILDHNFGQRVQRRFAARHDRDLGFKKKIELAGERSLRAASAFSNSLDAAERFGAPRNDQAGIAKLAFTQKNRGRALHSANLARRRHLPSDTTSGLPLVDRSALSETD